MVPPRPDEEGSLGEDPWPPSGFWEVILPMTLLTNLLVLCWMVWKPPRALFSSGMPLLGVAPVLVWNFLA